MSYLFRAIKEIFKKEKRDVDLLLEKINKLRKGHVDYIDIYKEENIGIIISTFKGVSIMDIAIDIQKLVNLVISSNSNKLPQYIPFKGLAINLFDEKLFNQDPNESIALLIDVIEGALKVSIEYETIDTEKSIKIKSIILYFSVIIESLIIIKEKIRG